MKPVTVLASLLALLLSVQLSAQGKYKHRHKRKYYVGYIVTNYGDTILGQIKEDANFTTLIKFIPDNDSLERTVKIPVKDVRIVKVNLMIFEKVIVKGKMRLFEKVAYGYYDLFAYNYQRGDIIENRYLLRLKEQTIKVEPRNFMEILERYLYDCPEIRQKAVSKQYRFDDVIDIFRTYNRWKAVHL